MDAAVLVARLVLAAVLGVAGVAKLLHPKVSRASMASFGIPPALVGAAAAVIPLAEVAVAVLLVPATTAEAAAIAVFLMLAAFTLGVGVNLVRGRTPACGCFGAVSSQPIGPATVVRNLALMALAAFVALGEAADEGASLGAWFSGLTTVEKAGALFAAALVVAVTVPVLVVRSEVEPRADPDADDEEEDEDWDGLPIGDGAPPFTLRDVGGSEVTLASLLAPGRPVLLVFAAPSCQSCAALLPDVAAWERDLAGELAVAVVSSDAEAGRTAADEHGLRTVLEDGARDVAEAYRTLGTPAAVVVGVDGRIATETAHGADEIHALVDREQWRVFPPLTG
ncbi:MAG TPA: MauE/DoxX family redox-associated membrane protein [Actinomycetota bacterium]|nr:MauE/DoxX family redox-associated membrane protein [Actinomycetota bacterium]